MRSHWNSGTLLQHEWCHYRKTAKWKTQRRGHAKCRQTEMDIEPISWRVPGIPSRLWNPGERLRQQNLLYSPLKEPVSLNSWVQVSSFHNYKRKNIPLFYCIQFVVPYLQKLQQMNGELEAREIEFFLTFSRGNSSFHVVNGVVGNKTESAEAWSGKISVDQPSLLLGIWSSALPLCRENTAILNSMTGRLFKRNRTLF